MPQSTFSSTSNTSSDYTPRTLTTSNQTQTPSYPRTLDINLDASSSSSEASSSSYSFSSSTTSRPLMPYSVQFTSDWKKDFTNDDYRQNKERSSWSTRGNSGSNP
ncbi:hypothetical protein F5Y08DRAFT_9077 [Xylaria arbuscula]|nr:hypothetical protein F5Y08DRAFT_9077 [Xylaria arbuscula]